jgi:hypothetical protein
MEVEDIIRRRMLRWTIQHSSPHSTVMEEIVYICESSRPIRPKVHVQNDDPRPHSSNDSKGPDPGVSDSHFHRMMEE